MSGSTSDSDKLRRASQLPLPLPTLPPRYSRDAFLIAPSNEAAWRAGQAWLDSSENSLIICGPKGAGKTHLATILLDGRGAFCDWRLVSTATYSGDRVVLDNLPASDPRIFMTTLEDLAQAGIRTILVGSGNPRDWALGLKDLHTRLAAIPRAPLEQPDEALLRAVISKSFNDRQIGVDQSVIEFTAPRLPRTFEAALLFAELADQEAAQRKKKITVGMAKDIIASAFETPTVA